MPAKEKATRHFGLTQRTIVIGAFAWAILVSFGFGGLGFGLPDVMAAIKGSTANAFWAAPVKTTLVVPENRQFSKWYAPPPYVSVTLSNVHSLQFRPSNCCGSVPKWLSLTSIDDKGGTTGIASGRPKPDCARIDVWLPESMKNMQKAPTTNDSNASIVFDIPPPKDGKGNDCAVSYYHYGTPPVKPPPKRHKRKSVRKIGRLQITDNQIGAEIMSSTQVKKRGSLGPWPNTSLRSGCTGWRSWV